MLISKFKRSDVIEDIKNWDKNVNVLFRNNTDNF